MIVEGKYNHIGRLKCCPWYIGKKSSLEAERDLYKLKDGTFLVYESIAQPGEYAIAIK